MHRTFITSVVAAAIAITGLSATPARAADGSDVARFLAGLAALAIVGAAIRESRDRDKQVVSRRDVPFAPPPRQYHQGKLKPRPLPPGLARRAVLPGQCLRSFDARHGQARLFGQRCLEKNYRHAGSLPQICAQRIRTKRGPRYGYDPRCLRQHGYRTARD